MSLADTPPISKEKASSIAIVRAGKIQAAPWFELLLFQTLCRFRIPKPSAELPRGLNGRVIDVRPFVNTLAKTHYADVKDAEVTGRHSQTFYCSAWGFYSRRWFAKPKATLNFELCGVAVCKRDAAEYPDLRDPAIALRWIQYSYRKNQIFNARFVLKHQGAYMSLDIKSQEEAETLVDHSDYNLEVCNINGHTAYRLKPESNRFDVLVPFTALDMLQFSFRLSFQLNLTHGQRADFLAQANQLAETIVNTMTLTYPECCIEIGIGK